MIGHPVSNPSSDSERTESPGRDEAARDESTPTDSEFDQRSR